MILIFKCDLTKLFWIWCKVAKAGIHNVYISFIIFSLILNWLYTFFSAVKDQLFQCASSIIQHKYNFKMDSCLTSLIWNNAMHSVGLNQCIEHGSQLLKDMIIGQDEGVQQYDELFNQYLQNRIRCCKPSIKTLIFLVKKRSKFINSLKTKQKLLNWLTGDEAQHWSYLIKVLLWLRFKNWFLVELRHSA